MAGIGNKFPPHVINAARGVLVFLLVVINPFEYGRTVPAIYKPINAGKASIGGPTFINRNHRTLSWTACQRLHFRKYRNAAGKPSSALLFYPRQDHIGSVCLVRSDNADTGAIIFIHGSGIA
jgi:hypothetical protein